MFQLILFLAAFFAVHLLLKKPPEILKKYAKILIISFIGMMLTYLLATGRLNWFFAFVIMTITFLFRLLPVALNLMPHWLQAHDLWQKWRNSTSKKESSRQFDYSGNMSNEEALEILGLTANASRDDIIAAHRKLIQKLHPDHGGSNYLATKINLAKQTLLS